MMFKKSNTSDYLMFYCEDGEKIEIWEIWSMANYILSGWAWQPQVEPLRVLETLNGLTSPAG